MAKIQVSSVVAATVAAPMLQITVRTRASKDAEGKKVAVAEKDKSRSILIQEWKPAVSSKYIPLVVAALHETAKKQLDAQWSENPAIVETDSELYTEDALLAYAAREAVSDKLNGEAIVAWWNQSALKAELVQKYNDKQLGKFIGELKNLAAPVPDYNEEKALKRIATLGKHEADTEHPTCQKMIEKLQRIIDKIRAEREELGSVEELDL